MDSRLTVDFIMIIGKYLSNPIDFINIMKVSKRYKDLVLMYKFNPISDISLFKNIQTQHFYKEEDVKLMKNGLYQYIYWYFIDYLDWKERKNNQIFKNVCFKKYLKTTDDIYYPFETEIIKNFDQSINYIVPDCITKINSEYFSIDGIKSIVLPPKLKQLNEYTFKSTYDLETVIINNGLTRIDDYCFYDSSINQISLPFTLKEIGIKAFNRSQINQIIIPDSVSLIEYACFYDCNLSSIELSNNLLSIPDECFRECDLFNIIIPDSIEQIGEACFFNCTNLTTIQLSNNLKSLSPSLLESTMITNITIPFGVTSIEKNCFRDCIMLTSVNLPNSLLSIHNNAFKRTSISSIKLNEGLTKLGHKCFKQCTNLTTINFPSTLKKIGYEIYSNSNVKSINTSFGNICNCLIPYSFAILLINSNVFCPYVYLDRQSITSGLIQITNGNCIIPDGIIEIGKSCFKNIRDLKTLTIPSSVKVISKYALFNTSIKQLIIPKSVESIMSSNLATIDTVYLPKSIKNFGHNNKTSNNKIFLY